MAWIGIDSKHNLRISVALAPSESDWDIHETQKMDVSGKHSKRPEELFKIPVITLHVLTINFLESWENYKGTKRSHQPSHNSEKTNINIQTYFLPVFLKNFFCCIDDCKFNYVTCLHLTNILLMFYSANKTLCASFIHLGFIYQPLVNPS